MDAPNAFIGKTTMPTAAELSSVLGATALIWAELIDSLAKEQGLDQEWNSFKPKYGWTLLLKLKKRRIVYLGPCVGCFRASFILGDKAVAAARASNLPKRVLLLLDEAPRYPEGTGLRLLVKTAN